MVTVAAESNLNVKKNNLNNKRLSRLQGVILKTLANIYPAGYPKRNLSIIVAHLYGKGSIITRDDKYKKQLAEFEKMEQDLLHSPLLASMLPFLKDIESTGKMVRGIVGRGIPGRRNEWLSPQFSVAYSRSMRNLLNQGFVRYSPTTNGRWCLFITDKGFSRIQGRKVKVHASNWEAFLTAINKQDKEAT
jgi:hypothetical protein